MPQHADPHLFVHTSRDGVAENVADSPGPAILLQFWREVNSFRHHNDGETLAETLAQKHVLADLLHREWNLRNEDDVSASRDSGFQRDPARVAAHHLDHHDAMMRFARGVDFVHSFGSGMQRGVETEGDFCGGKIVVDGLGHAHDLHALLKELERDLLRAISANGDYGIDSELVRVGDDFVGNIADDFHAVLNGAVVKGIAAISGSEDS